MRHITSPVSVAALCLLVLGSCGALIAGEDARAQLATLIPGVKPEMVSGIQVMEFRDNPGTAKNRGQSLQPAAARSLWRVGELWFVETSAGTWRSAHRELREPQPIVCEGPPRPLSEFLARGAFPPLPVPPAGWTVRQLAALPEHPTRMTAAAPGELLVLGHRGSVWRVAQSDGRIETVIAAADYLGADDPRDDDRFSALGIHLDAGRRLYLVVNQRDDAARPRQAKITIFRTPPLPAAGPAPKPQPWLRTAYPLGIGAFNHGVAHIARGPDGMLYVASGSRTDANEAGTDAGYSTAGEVDLTSCIWRLDPKSDTPRVEVFARGLRNPYGFCWDARGRMFAVDHGPNRDPPEELNLIVAGGHYGFPYRFADWSQTDVYSYQPALPAALRPLLPLRNRGPDGLAADGKTLATFTAHSAPTGLALLGPEFPADWRGCLLMTRCGTFISGVAESGFDLLRLRLIDTADGSVEIETHRVLAGVARPVDVVVTQGRVYVLEYNRSSSRNSNVMWLPGRLLELSPPVAGR